MVEVHTFVGVLTRFISGCSLITMAIGTAVLAVFWGSIVHRGLSAEAESQVFEPARSGRSAGRWRWPFRPTAGGCPDRRRRCSSRSPSRRSDRHCSSPSSWLPWPSKPTDLGVEARQTWAVAPDALPEVGLDGGGGRRQDRPREPAVGEGAERVVHRLDRCSAGALELELIGFGTPETNTSPSSHDAVYKLRQTPRTDAAGWARRWPGTGCMSRPSGCRGRAGR